MQIPQTSGSVPLLLAALLAAAVPLAFAIDLRIADFVRAYSFPREPGKIIQLAEVCGHVFGLAVAAALIWRLDPAWRQKVPALLVAVIAAGLAANLVKLMIVRHRPASFENFDVIERIWETFGTSLPFVSAGSSGQSFPSGHSALAAALAVMLARYYPRAAGVFAVLALLAMLHRIVTDSHFLSDVLAGAALGIFVAHLVSSVLERRSRAATE